MPPDSPGFGAPSARKLFFPCVHLQNLMLLCRPLVSYSLYMKSIPKDGKRDSCSRRGCRGGGGGLLKIVIAKGVQFSYVIIIIIIFFGGGKVLVHHPFLTPPPRT